MVSDTAVRRVRRGLFRAALGVSLFGVIAGIMLNLALPWWWDHQGQTIVTVTSGSMSPVIETGESILIQTATNDTVLEPGMVVTYTSGSADRSLTTHRIVDIKSITGQDGLWLQTKGDANRTPDPNLTPEGAVVGVVHTHLGWLGPVMREAQRGEWRLAAFGPALILLAVAELPALFRREPDEAEPGPVQEPLPVG